MTPMAKQRPHVANGLEMGLECIAWIIKQYRLVADIRWVQRDQGYQLFGSFISRDAIYRMRGQIRAIMMAYVKLGKTVEPVSNILICL